MENDKRNTQCFLWCKGLTISMSKKEMAGLLETLIERNLTLIDFTEKNDNMKPVDRAKRIQELSFQALEANKLLEKLLHSDQKAAGSPGFSSDYYGEHE